jgi:hypothetical protein
MFLSSDQGVFLTNGNTLKQLSDNIKPTIDSLSAAAKNNSAAWG